jgi:hypothetical protein
MTPGEHFEGILKNVSNTRSGKALLPRFASTSNTVQSLSGALSTRLTSKQGLIRMMMKNGASISDLNLSLDVPRSSIKTYGRKGNKAAEDSQKKLAKLTRDDARRKKMVPGEMKAVTKHAQSYMMIKSGAATDVWLLSTSLKSLYVAYRRDFVQVLLDTILEGKQGSDDRNLSSKVHRNNQRLITQGATDVEPWQEYITHLKLFVGKRRAANLSTEACTNLIVNDNGKMEVVEVKPPDHQPKHQVVDYSNVPNELEATIKRSRDKGDQLRPRGYKTWKAIITRNESFRWRSIRTPYSCDVCKGAYAVERKWSEAAEVVRTADPKTPEKTNALSEAYLAYQDMSKLEQHKLQLENQRFFVQTLEKNLPNKSKLLFKIMVYMDFVAQYNYAKKKVANLVFTIKWRDENGQLQYKYIDNFCSDETKKSDAMYVKCAWEFHLRPVYLRKQLATTGVLSDATKKAYSEELARNDALHGKRDEFAGVTHIVRTGDNGGHLLNRILMKMESSVYRKYGIDFETHTLPKRHGYNMCDGHGGAVKRTINQFGVSNFDPENAHDFANIINGWVTGLTADCLRHSSCTAYAMVNIPRLKKDELKAACRSCTGMQRACEFIYTCKNDKGEVVHTPGIMRVKEVSGCKDEEPLICDILKRDVASYGKICNGCTRTKEYPVYHKKDIWTEEKTVCSFRSAKGQMLSFKRPGMYPHADRSTFLNVPVVRNLLVGNGTVTGLQLVSRKRKLKPAADNNSNSITRTTACSSSTTSSSSVGNLLVGNETVTGLQSESSKKKLKLAADNNSNSITRTTACSSSTTSSSSSRYHNQSRSISGQFGSRDANRQTTVGNFSEVVAAIAAPSSTTPSIALDSSSKSGDFKNQPLTLIGLTKHVGYSAVAAASSPSSSEDEDEPLINMQLAPQCWMVAVIANSYEYGGQDGKTLIPLYQCKWYKNKDKTWQFENSIPPELLRDFKQKKSHYLTEKEFLDRQRKTEKKAARAMTKVNVQQPPEPSEYEKKAASQKKQNEEMMRQLGLHNLTDSEDCSDMKIVKKRKTTAHKIEPRFQPARECKNRRPTQAAESSALETSAADNWTEAVGTSSSSSSSSSDSDS